MAKTNVDKDLTPTAETTEEATPTPAGVERRDSIMQVMEDVRKAVPEAGQETSTIDPNITRRIEALISDESTSFLHGIDFFASLLPADDLNRIAQLALKDENEAGFSLFLSNVAQAKNVDALAPTVIYALQNSRSGSEMFLKSLREHRNNFKNAARIKDMVIAATDYWGNVTDLVDNGDFYRILLGDDGYSDVLIQSFEVEGGFVIPWLLKKPLVLEGLPRLDEILAAAKAKERPGEEAA